MSGQSSNRWVGRLRSILLGTLTLFVVILVSLYLFGRSTRTDTPAPEAVRAGERSVETLLASEGWEYEVSGAAGRPVFSIRGERMISDRESNVVLEGVGLTLFRDDGATWDVECARGSYNKETGEAHLEGDVRVTGSTGLSLRTEGVIVAKGGRLFRSTSDVHFRYLDQYEGRADELSANQRSDFYLLSGNVEVHSLAGAETSGSLSSARLVFDRPRRLVRALGKVQLKYGSSRLEARRLSATLSEDEKEIRFVRALGVTAGDERIRGDGRRETLSITAATVALVMDDVATGTVRDLELKGRSGRAATVTSSDSTGIARQIQAHYIVSHGMTPQQRRFRAYAPVEFKEYFTFAPEIVTAWACADTADIELRDERLVKLVLDGRSELWRDALYATGDTIDFDVDRGSTALTGPPARVLTERGELEAPAILQIHFSDEIQAHGGVQGRMERSGSALAGGGGPIQVEAEELVWRRDPEQLVLTGDVQAWQDDQLLIADEVEEDVEAERLEARGSVRTVWTPRPGTTAGSGEDATEGPVPDADAVAEEDGSDNPTATPMSGREPLEVTAGSSVYDRSAGLVTYAGGSRARQGKRTLACEELELELTESGAAQRMLCHEAVVIRDAEHQRTVRGDLAIYDPAQSEVRVSGERVTLKAEDGTSMVGPVMIYDFESGKARVESESLLGVDPLTAGEGER